MDDLTAARAQMEVSLGFHMVFAALGIALPLLMVIAEGLALRTGQAHYRDLAKQWSKATALLFAVGAVSGTALSFELGLLWPTFMAQSGSLIGPAFAMEGFAFFIEAIFIGIYLYGWDRLSPRAHWLAGFPIAVSGLLSGLFVVATNAWMQVPVGYEVVDGDIVQTDPLAVFKTPVWLPMAFHLLVSCYVAAAWSVAGVYAWARLRGKRSRYHTSALRISMVVAVASTVLLGPSGDLAAHAVARYEPVKFASMEALFETQAGAPFTIGGIPLQDEERTILALEIPYLLSLLAHRDPHAVVQGLDQVPRELEPNVLLVHLSFQVMIAIGGVLAVMAVWYAWGWWRRRASHLDSPWLLRGIVACGPLAYVAIQAGWLVTEAGRQPWTIRGVLLTRDAVTPAPGLLVTFLAFTLLYVVLAFVLVALLRLLASRPPPSAREEAA
ncbi:MAG TPA: cytochrome ubiquinol oxidase subunit I [Candidatus Thermoplasmatota archaeon]|nr:cytochrome ubiquinol oxidase subunit I [Candidatus Thermoplasmatota archaeon]